MRIGCRATEDEFHIRIRQRGFSLDESKETARHIRARSLAEEISLHHRQRHAVETQQLMEETRLIARPCKPRRQMVLQIFAHRQINQRLDALFAQMRIRPDARQHQQLRCIERAR